MAAQLGQAFADQNIRLVYGGGGLGLMGTLARTAHEAGGDVLGIIPEFLREAEKSLTQVNHRFVPNMHERKSQMYQEADGFIVLPGGIGTLEEVIEVLSWARLSLHRKPIIFLGSDDYWHTLIDLLEFTITEGFAPDSLRGSYSYASDPNIAIIMALTPLPPSEVDPLALKLSDL